MSKKQSEVTAEGIPVEQDVQPVAEPHPSDRRTAQFVTDGPSKSKAISPRGNIIEYR